MDAETTELNQDGKLEQASSFEDFLEVVSRPDPLADLVIDVEGRKIQTSKYLLANVSSKFRQMLTDAGAENPNVLMLPGTSLHAVTELLRWLLPSEETVLSDGNVKLLLQLAVDYDIKKLHKHCDQYLVGKLKACKQHVDRVKYLMMADQFKLPDAFEEAVVQLSRLTMVELNELEKSVAISPTLSCEILKRRVGTFETNACEPETVTLVVDDREIEVPSAVLSTASDVFKVMVTSNFLERQTGRVVMPGKRYDAVKFMVHYITSKDYVPIPGELLADVFELAEEYMLGRLKHACIEYMVSNADKDKAELNDCLLYLRLAQTYHLSDVDDKILEEVHRRSTVDIQACSNYDVEFIAPLMMRHAQWLEEQFRKCILNVEGFESQLDVIKDALKSDVREIFENICSVAAKPSETVTCADGHTLEPYKKFFNHCPECALLSRRQFRGYIHDLRHSQVTDGRSLTVASIFDKLEGGVSKLKQCCGILKGMTDGM